MKWWIEPAFILLSVVAGLYLLRRMAPALGLVDRPNHRSLHRHPVPRGGGIVFVSVALIGLLLFHYSLFVRHWPETVALLLVWSVGVLDDRREAMPHMKFFFIAVATLILWWAGIVIDEVGRYAGKEIHLGMAALPFTFFALAGFTNAMNLIDGIDGLAGIISLSLLAAIAYLGWRYSDPFLWHFSWVFLIAVSAFLLFNWHPATLFMGDSGSLSMGFLIGMLLVVALKYLPSVSALYLGAVPIADTLVVMVRRKLAGRSAADPDRCHLHHLLLYQTGSVRGTVLLIGGVQALFVAGGLSMHKGADQTLPLVLFLLMVVLLYWLVKRMICKLGVRCYATV